MCLATQAQIDLISSGINKCFQSHYKREIPDLFHWVKSNLNKRMQHGRHFIICLSRDESTYRFSKRSFELLQLRSVSVTFVEPCESVGVMCCILSPTWCWSWDREEKTCTSETNESRLSLSMRVVGRCVYVGWPVWVVACGDDVLPQRPLILCTNIFILSLNQLKSYARVENDLLFELMCFWNAF